ncbi:DUF2950 domain-containing protein [Cupriavidus pampae]|uniref:DUF2950 domain-containing protein n=1 Tax=Cupriavidus pampae TaxID=659251 RepID=A0ABN7XU08_9BURK|nr:hypothetical protein LMG32289_00834 [Cupriavidus pampae]
MYALTCLARQRIARALFLFAMLAAGSAPGYAQRAFDTPEAAMNAFGDAIATSNDTAVQAMLGPTSRNVIPPLGADLRYRFLAAWSQAHGIKMDGERLARVSVGQDGWTLPIPLVQSNGKWYFDMRAGLDEIRFRRIGRNELNTIQTMLAIYDAQREYADGNHGPNGMSVYARKLVSSQGKKDGLYWPTPPGEPESPLGPAFIEAATKLKGGEGYHGYRYKLLTSQRSSVNGNTYTYVVNGQLFGGFAVLAWPVRYGETGIKSFMINHEGKVYERDMGPDTAARAASIESFDPDRQWTEVSAQALAPQQ